MKLREINRADIPNMETVLRDGPEACKAGKIGVTLYQSNSVWISRPEGRKTEGRRRRRNDEIAAVQKRPWNNVRSARSIHMAPKQQPDRWQIGGQECVYFRIVPKMDLHDVCVRHEA